MSVCTLMITLFIRNFCPQEWKFQGANVPWNFRSMEHSSLRTKVPGDESSRERKFHPMELSSLGTKVLRDESSIIRATAVLYNVNWWFLLWFSLFFTFARVWSEEWLEHTNKDWKHWDYTHYNEEAWEGILLKHIRFSLVKKRLCQIN